MIVRRKLNKSVAFRYGNLYSSCTKFYMVSISSLNDKGSRQCLSVNVCVFLRPQSSEDKVVMRQKESAPLLFFVTETKATFDCAAARQQEPSRGKDSESQVK